MDKMTAILMFGYVARGLDYLSINEHNGINVGNEEHPHLNEGEYEAMRVIAEFLADTVDDSWHPNREDVTLYDFYYVFCKQHLPSVFYSAPENWGTLYPLAWSVFLEEFK